MKSLMPLFCFFLTMPMAHANLEHKSGQEAEPTASEVNLHRGCFQAAAELGCGHPESHAEFGRCIRDHAADFTGGCQAMFVKLYGTSSAE
jgi:hypothetical protein